MKSLQWLKKKKSLGPRTLRAQQPDLTCEYLPRWEEAICGAPVPPTSLSMAAMLLNGKLSRISCHPYWNAPGHIVLRTGHWSGALPLKTYFFTFFSAWRKDRKAKKFMRLHLNRKKNWVWWHLSHPSYCGKPKIEGSWSRPAWANSKALSQK
jgi:hypothetical protein